MFQQNNVMHLHEVAMSSNDYMGCNNGNKAFNPGLFYIICHINGHYEQTKTIN